VPRTPLFRALQRSFRLARLAVETGRPAGEMAEIVRESAGLTRRPLLGGTTAAAGLDRMPLSQWLDGAGAEPWLRKLLDVAYTTEYGLETAEQSALNFLLLLDSNPLPFRIFGENDERFHVKGGNDRIPKELARRLGDRVETGTRVEAISRRSEGSYAVSIRRGGKSETVTADHVVIAVPFTMLRGRAGSGWTRAWASRRSRSGPSASWLRHQFEADGRLLREDLARLVPLERQHA
jgi:monoamine oxidase